MTAEQKVPSVEMCRKLWDAGLRLETERAWVTFDGQPTELLFSNVQEWALIVGEENAIPAPDLAELLDVFPGDGYTSERDPDIVVERILGYIANGIIRVSEVNKRTKGQP